MKKILLLVNFFAVLTFYSCAPIYVPNMRNTPLMSKAGEVQASVQYGTSGLDLQGAVAVTNNIAVMGNFSYGNRNTDTTTYSNNTVNDNYHKHNLYEGGIGYYKNQGQFCFEVFAGYGVGEGSSYGSYAYFSNTSSSDKLTTGKFTRIFLQPSFGIKKKVVTIAFTPRISIVDFTEIYEPKYPSVKLDVQPKVFIEPAFTSRFNFLDNRFFGNIQVGISQSLSENVYFDYVHFNFSTGLGFRIGGDHWETKSKSE